MTRAIGKIICSLGRHDRWKVVGQAIDRIEETITVQCNDCGSLGHLPYGTIRWTLGTELS